MARNRPDDDRPRRKAKSGGMPVWGWVLLGVGGLLFVGGGLVCAGMLWVGKKTGEAITETVEKGQQERAKDEDEILTLIDRTETLKGKTIRLEAKVSTSIFANKNQSIRDYRGKDVEFYAFSRVSNSRLNITIRMPDSDLPAAVYGDSLAIVFVCTEGHKERGNVASQVHRVTK